MQPKIFGHPQYFDSAHRYEGELFLPIPGEKDGYTISNYGRVKSEGLLSRNLAGPFITPTRILRPATNHSGYYAVSLNDHTRALQTLMRRVFMPEMAHVREVDHIDGDKSNNVLSNLECVTSKENKKRGIKLGLINNVGEAHGMAKLNEEQVWEVLTEYHLNKLSRKLVSEKLGIAEFTVKMIHNGTNWKHVYARFAEQHPEAVATNRAQTRLTAEQAVEIFQRKKAGESTRALMAAYDMSKDTINKIFNRKLWPSATEGL
jgi:hypothetical protein